MLGPVNAQRYGSLRLASFEAIVAALSESRIRYLVVGGLAVNAHGYLRFTKDVDLVLDLDAPELPRALMALKDMGYRPTVPVTIEAFADPAQRAEWIENQGMQVFQLWSDAHPETPIDIFASLPFPFDVEYGQALRKVLHGSREVRFVSISTLIEMKRRAGRPQDLVDVEHLRMRLEDGADD